MQTKSKLEELSSNLSEGERRELLDKINKSMEGQDGEYYVHVEIEDDDKKKIIAGEINKLSPLRRFVLWFLKTVSGKNREQVYLTMKIADIKRSVKRASPGLTGFETRELTVKFIRSVYDIYNVVYPMREFYQYYVSEPALKEQIVFSLVAANFPQAKNTLADFIGQEEIEEIYSRSNGSPGIQQTLSKRFDEYFKSLPGSLFQKIEQEIMPVLAMKNIALFNYKELFQYFDYYLPPSLEKKYPLFRASPALLVIDHLERLYYALYYALKNTENSTAISENVLSAYVVQKLGLDYIGGGNAIADRQDEINAELSILKTQLQALISEVIRFYSLVPLLDLIKYFRRDPYYRFKFYLPQLPLKQIYSQSLRKHLKGELDAQINSIKDAVIDHKIQDLFRDLVLIPLNHYTDSAAEMYLRLGLPYFGRVKSLTLLHNYLLKVYKEFIQDILQIVNTYFFTNNKRNQNRLLQLVSSINEVEDKIVMFDRSLSPEEDDGKTIQRLRYNIATDLTHQKLFKSFLSDKDRDAQNLLERGSEALSSFRGLFEEIITMPAESVQLVLKTLVAYKGRQYTVVQLLQLLTINLGDFLKLLNQIMDMEKGR